MKLLLTSTRRRRKGSTVLSTDADADSVDAGSADANFVDADSKFRPLLPTDFAHPAFDKTRNMSCLVKSEVSSTSSFSSSSSSSSSSEDVQFRDSSIYSSSTPLSSYFSSSSLRVSLGPRSSRQTAFASTNNLAGSVVKSRVGSVRSGAGLSTRHRHAPAWWILVAMMLYSSGIVGIPVVISSADDVDQQEQQQQQQQQQQRREPQTRRDQAFDHDWEWRQWNEEQLQRRQNDFQHRKGEKDNVFDEMKNGILNDKGSAPSSSSSSSSKRRNVDDSLKKNLHGGKSTNSLLRNNRLDKQLFPSVGC